MLYRCWACFTVAGHLSSGLNALQAFNLPGQLIADGHCLSCLPTPAQPDGRNMLMVLLDIEAAATLKACVYTALLSLPT